MARVNPETNSVLGFTFFRRIGDLLRSDVVDTKSFESALPGTVSLIAGLTALDGATVVSDEYELLAFGAKIRRREGCPVVEDVLVTEPVEGAELEVCHPEELGGMRHVSASQFVRDQRDAIALVSSQDGRFTSFEWFPSRNMVLARRLEMLLL